MNRTVYGLDLAKRVFQMYWVDVETGEMENRRFSRESLIEFLVKRKQGVVVIEACGSSHWWARKIESLGHEVKMIHARFVRPFVQGNKTDKTDAKAIWTAANQPDMRFVTPKTEDQQAMLGLHRVREELVKMRTAMINQTRGLLYEFGITLPKGRKAGIAEIQGRMVNIEEAVPGLLMNAIKDNLCRIEQLDKDIKDIEKQMNGWHKKEDICQKLSEVTGIGLLTATALVATLGDGKAFKSGRGFAAFLGLVPKQSGTGGIVKLGGISKRGNTYLRKLLIHGARSALFKAKEPGEWEQSLLARRPKNVAVIAKANKLARIAWALVTRGDAYNPKHVSIKPGSSVMV